MAYGAYKVTDYFVGKNAGTNPEETNAKIRANEDPVKENTGNTSSKNSNQNNGGSKNSGKNNANTKNSNTAKNNAKSSQTPLEESAVAAKNGAETDTCPLSKASDGKLIEKYKNIPSVKNGKFNKFFDSLTSDELDILWKDPNMRGIIEARLRSPGGLHELHLVSRTPIFKRWGISAEQIKTMRTLTSDVRFVNPEGVHGGRGSTTAHNELLQIIDSSNDYNTFIRRLNNWANYKIGRWK